MKIASGIRGLRSKQSERVVLRRTKRETSWHVRAGLHPSTHRQEGPICLGHRDLYRSQPALGPRVNSGLAYSGSTRILGILGEKRGRGEEEDGSSRLISTPLADLVYWHNHLPPSHKQRTPVPDRADYETRISGLGTLCPEGYRTWCNRDRDERHRPLSLLTATEGRLRVN